MKTMSEALYETWDKRWEGSEEKERLTFIGRLMFKAKEKVLATAIKDITVANVIEIGCGLGHTMEVYNKNGLSCVGIDVSSHAVSVCRNKGLNVTQSKLEDISEKYDLVSSDGMLEHFLNFEPYAQQLMNISKNYILLIQPNHDSFWGKTLAYLAELIRGRENVFEYNYRIKDFITVFQNNGFEITGNYPVFCDVFRLLLFKKA
ncbi:MAG: class I SAM-dependent methyltransferase [Candidatus Scalindua rubra]|uniref:Dihydroxyhexaprenylbenzoate methyltransferase n=1 Tax=Candidatus Scalindua brodae TaxID=237368 RepID=A0A0B0EFX8_9BACT|nr:MAG: dihydroxyhexaprenylbenzoate methyltransferase [Candidatus Scalindua brodae]MBZ0108272.1 class I SAM-dependent methyltransferase [Candidatus Scalindua rubra]TWU33969.1 bifunctional 3-demethylubiquinone-9 3-methyltransferase/ 2-octaprenyl-6-hydroxy phenol methylase [Candidatus Brocadiaceae bacterium S225]